MSEDGIPNSSSQLEEDSGLIFESNQDEAIERSTEQMRARARAHLFSGKKGKIKAKNFAGLSLGGGKTDKTCLAVLEFYPHYNKIFLSRLYSRIKSESETEVSADQMLFHLLTKNEKIHTLGIDTPLKLPKCLRCKLKCPGYEKCSESEIKWMWKHYRERNDQKRPNKLFTPYTERCAELYVSSSLEEEFHPSHALGANLAPLTARALFLQRRLSIPMIEVYPKLTLWRIGRALGVAKSHLRFHKHSVGGEESREAILERLIQKDIAFIYEQDARTMIEFAPAFDAFICSLTAVLAFKGQTESRPKGYPRSEAWIEFPKENIRW